MDDILCKKCGDLADYFRLALCEPCAAGVAEEAWEEARAGYGW